MNLLFNIDYNTTFGEELVLNLSYNLKDSQSEVSKFKMFTSDGKSWIYRLDITPEAPNTVLDYYYSVEVNGQECRREWAALNHRLEIPSDANSAVTVYDHWSDIPEDSYLYSSAFTDCIGHDTFGEASVPDFDRSIRITVRAPQLNENHRLSISGPSEMLGEWNVDRALPMTEHNTHEWVIDIDASKIQNRILEFKFVAFEGKLFGTPIWESGSNRTVAVPRLKSGERVVYTLMQASFPLPGIRLAGTLIPVFSLRTEGSFGVGDFGDLKSMIDYVAATGQRLLQVLPINDTTITHTWTDSYPYSCISIFALHPQYVDLRQLPRLKDAEMQKHFDGLRSELNALPQIDYERVNEAKNDFMRHLFAQEGKAMMASESFRTFFSSNELWLVPYAQYCLLRDKNGTADFNAWHDHNAWDEQERARLSNPRTKAYQEVAFYYFMQYVLDVQMTSAHDYARSKRVILKGDIPIGVNRNGCDVWMEPKYFNLNGQAGAPPDAFSVNGQNWGFPTYNWDEMLKDGCAWWVRRFRNMSKYFDAYRIDHVLGFFRIWEIPSNAVHGLLGQFSPALGMSREEIASYGIYFREELFTRPFITDWVLDRIFKEHADEVRTQYLDHLHDDVYSMKPEYDTQRKIEAAFADRTTDKDVWIRDGLYSLISDVLFLRDNKDATRFHPRISAQYDFIYESLDDGQKAAFNKLYNDYFYRRNNDFWYHEAMRKMPKLVNATRMLVCAEDLGMVPDSVAWVMQELRILSLEVQTMPKDSRVRFSNLALNPYRSVCTISSHDMPTLRQWWDENYERAQNYFNSMLWHGGAAPHPMPSWLARDIIERHLQSPSMLCVLSLQDWLATDEDIRLADADAERINIPANPKHYWRYRMHLTIEQLMADSAFCGSIADMISKSRRC